MSPQMSPRPQASPRPPHTSPMPGSVSSPLPPMGHNVVSNPQPVAMPGPYMNQSQHGITHHHQHQQQHPQHQQQHMHSAASSLQQLEQMVIPSSNMNTSPPKPVSTSTALSNAAASPNRTPLAGSPAQPPRTPSSSSGPITVPPSPRLAPPPSPVAQSIIDKTQYSASPTNTIDMKDTIHQAPSVAATATSVAESKEKQQGPTNNPQQHVNVQQHGPMTSAPIQPSMAQHSPSIPQQQHASQSGMPLQHSSALNSRATMSNNGSNVPTLTGMTPGQQHSVSAQHHVGPTPTVPTLPLSQTDSSPRLTAVPVTACSQLTGSNAPPIVGPNGPHQRPGAPVSLAQTNQAFQSELTQQLPPVGPLVPPQHPSGAQPPTVGPGPGLPQHPHSLVGPSVPPQHSQHPQQHPQQPPQKHPQQPSQQNLPQPSQQNPQQHPQPNQQQLPQQNPQQPSQQNLQQLPQQNPQHAPIGSSMAPQQHSEATGPGPQLHPSVGSAVPPQHPPAGPATAPQHPFIGPPTPAQHPSGGPHLVPQHMSVGVPTIPQHPQQGSGPGQQHPMISTHEQGAVGNTGPSFQVPGSSSMPFMPSQQHQPQHSPYPGRMNPQAEIQHIQQQLQHLYSLPPNPQTQQQISELHERMTALQRQGWAPGVQMQHQYMGGPPQPPFMSQVRY